MKTEQHTILPPLGNRYFALRHGQSQANVESIIVSNPAVGVTAYGLTVTGREQVSAAMEQPPAGFDTHLKIISSDFMRARETAAIVASRLAATEPVCYSEQLRERFFGTLDGGTDERYAQVWLSDRVDPWHCESGVESAVAVVQRTVDLIRQLELRYQGAIVLLVAHGDVLQLLQTAFAGVSPALHRRLPPLQVAEIRALRRLEGET